MNVIPLQVFVGLVLVAFAVLLLAWSLRQADHEHADRLSLLPIEDDAPVEPKPPGPEPAPRWPAT